MNVFGLAVCADLNASAWVAAIETNCSWIVAIIIMANVSAKKTTVLKTIVNAIVMVASVGLNASVLSARTEKKFFMHRRNI